MTQDDYVSLNARTEKKTSSKISPDRIYSPLKIIEEEKKS